ncbi:MAG: TonB-dependent receptor [Candidatus Omnitrophota bacterium]
MVRSPNAFLFSIIFLCALVPAGEVYAVSELEPIVIQRVPQGASRAPGAVSAVLVQDDIQNYPAASPEDLLQYLGVDVQTRGARGIKSDISLNASTFQQVLILVNGVRVKDSQTSHHDLDLWFNIDDIERIEIIPAAAAAVYGSDGIGGAVNFILKKPTQEKSSLSLAAGNHNTFEEKLELSYGALGGHSRLSVGNVESDGSRFDTDYRANTFFHSTVFESDNASLAVNAGYNEKEFGAYDFYTPGRGYPSKEWTNTKFFDVRAAWDAGRLRLEPHANFREHHDKFMLNVNNPSLYLNHHRTDTYEVGNRLVLPFAHGEFGLGADYAEERITSNNLGKHLRTRWDIYLNPVFELSERQTLDVALRCDDYSTFGQEFTGSLTLRHLFDENTNGYISVGRNMRVPTFTELYYNDPTTTGDSSLKPEHAVNVEAGWKSELRQGLDASLSVFVRNEHDTIDYTKLTSSDVQFMARNTSEAVTGGINAFIRWQASQKLSLDLRYGYAIKDLKDGGRIYKYGVNYTKHFVDFGIDNVLPFGHNRMDFIVKKKPSRRAWVLVNDRLAWDVRENIEVFFEVYNLGNVEYQEIDGIPEQGRLLKVGTKFTW